MKFNLSLNNIINKLKKFWEKKGCINVYPLNIEIGAATFHYINSLYILKKKKIFINYLQLCNRPNDSKFKINYNKLQQYLQFQVIIKPYIKNIQILFIESLKYLGINLFDNDLKFINDNWENPTLGAYGIGWEIWLNGLEITQITFFKKMCGLICDPTIEITYGIERLGLILQNKKNIYELIIDKKLKYKNLFLLNELESSIYNLNLNNIKNIISLCNKYYIESKKILKFKKCLILPAYKNILKTIYYFNILDSKKIFTKIERQRIILKIKKIVKNIANIFIKNKIY